MDMQTPAADGRRDPLQFIFFNQRGLRPGWRLAIFAALVVFLTLSLPFLLSRLARLLGPGLSPPSLIVFEALQFAVVVFASWVMSRIEHRDMAEYGLPLRNAGALSRFIRG